MLCFIHVNCLFQDDEEKMSHLIEESIMKSRTLTTSSSQPQLIEQKAWLVHRNWWKVAAFYIIDHFLCSFYCQSQSMLVWWIIWSGWPPCGICWWVFRAHVSAHVCTCDKLPLLALCLKCRTVPTTVDDTRTSPPAHSVHLRCVYFNWPVFQYLSMYVRVPLFQCLDIRVCVRYVFSSYTNSSVMWFTWHLTVHVNIHNTHYYEYYSTTPSTCTFTHVEAKNRLTSV